MESLTFKALKVIADNLEFSQTADLVKLLINRLNQMKLIKIKETLLEKFQTHDQLTEFIPWVEKIDSMSVFFDETLHIDLNGEPSYQITIDQHENKVNTYISVNFKIETRTGKMYTSMQREKDPTTYDYLHQFGNIFLYSFSLHEDDDLGWGISIMEFLSIDNQDTELLLH